MAAKEYTSLNEKDTAKPNFLFAYEWSRVIMDEGHNLQDPDSKRSLGLTNLNTKFRGIISGTPFQNDYKSLFSVFRYLGAEPFRRHKNFKPLFVCPEERFTDRSKRVVESRKAVLGVFIASLTVQRHGNDIIEGECILKDGTASSIQYIAVDEMNDDQKEYNDKISRLWNENHMRDRMQRLARSEPYSIDEYTEVLDERDDPVIDTIGDSVLNEALKDLQMDIQSRSFVLGEEPKTVQSEQEITNSARKSATTVRRTFGQSGGRNTLGLLVHARMATIHPLLPTANYSRKKKNDKDAISLAEEIFDIPLPDETDEEAFDQKRRDQFIAEMEEKHSLDSPILSKMRELVSDLLREKRKIIVICDFLCGCDVGEVSI
jgi:SNF2 domain-containing protein